MGSYRQSNNQHSQQNTSANNNHNCNCHHSNRNNCNCRGKEEVVVDPTRTIVNTNTRKRVVKHVHPTEVINVNRTVVRNEHFFPVSEREVNETVEENYNCGQDPERRGNCRPFWSRF
ncbi:CotD family spore coat protein [Virgibacillus halophilus]|uniref:CotD family spore coat protein n=1 Tax=Tigheibacillus halophilus TaxID=361280 RepID=UPI00362A29C7